MWWYIFLVLFKVGMRAWCDFVLRFFLGGGMLEAWGTPGVDRIGHAHIRLSLCVQLHTPTGLDQSLNHSIDPLPSLYIYIYTITRSTPSLPSLYTYTPGGHT